MTLTLSESDVNTFQQIAIEEPTIVEKHVFIHSTKSKKLLLS
jgi:hypothetical protein